MVSWKRWAWIWVSLTLFSVATLAAHTNGMNKIYRLEERVQILEQKVEQLEVEKWKTR